MEVHCESPLWIYIYIYILRRIYYGRYIMADTLRHAYYIRYITTDILRQIYHGRYTMANILHHLYTYIYIYITADMLHGRYHCGNYITADILWQIFDMADILQQIHCGRYIASDKNGHISTNVQRHNLWIAAPASFRCNASPQGLLWTAPC